MLQTIKNYILKESTKAMSMNNYCESNKIALICWVDMHGIKHCQKKIMLGLQVTRIWSHNPKAMDNKTSLNEITLKSIPTKKLKNIHFK
jgi:hypothetical protein